MWIFYLFGKMRLQISDCQHRASSLKLLLFSIMSSRGIFSPLGTPTPLGSMAHSTLTPLETPGEVEGLKQMDYHLREMETYEQQKLEQSVNVSQPETRNYNSHIVH